MRKRWKGFKFQHVLEIFKADMRDALKNKPMLIILIGLTILPSFYAWFNIGASWDPYGNTKNMKVAIVNEDKGTTVFKNEFNAGDKLVEQLETNDKFDWQFVNRAKAIKNIKSGKYYAYILVPEDFSKDLASVLKKDIKKATLEYTVNEKLNAIAPKITAKGADAIQHSLNETIQGMMGKIIFTASGVAGYGLDHDFPKLNLILDSMKSFRKSLDSLDGDMKAVTNFSNDLTSTMTKQSADIRNMKNNLNNIKKMTDSLSDTLLSAKSASNSISNNLRDDVSTLNSLASSTTSIIDGIDDSVGDRKEDTLSLLDSFNQKIDSMDKVNSSTLKFLDKLNNLNSKNLLSAAIRRHERIQTTLSKLRGMSSDIRADVLVGSMDVSDSLHTMSRLVDDLSGQASDAQRRFSSDVSGPISDLLSSSSTVAQDASRSLDKAGDMIPNITNLLDQLPDLNTRADKRVDAMRRQIPTMKELTDLTISDLQDLLDSKEIKDLADVMQYDIIKRADFIKTPVHVKTHIMYPIENYGSAMSPFYSVLACWVGVLLLSSLITTEVEGKYKHSEIYFGRGMTFMMISLLQGLIIGLGDIFLLAIQCKHPVIYIGLLVLSSFSFCFIIYSLVSVFSNIGKALSILMLVVQIGASGGTFPIQVTPRFFRIIHPIAPFTYGISACREALAGIYYPTLYRDIAALLIFAVLFMLFGVFMKSPINRATKKVREEYESSRLAE